MLDYVVKRGGLPETSSRYYTLEIGLLGFPLAC